MNRIKAFCYIKKKYWIIAVIGAAIAIILGMVLSLIFIKTGEMKPDETVLFNIIFFSVYYTIMHLLFRSLYHVENASRALAYGMTRKTYFINNIVTSILEAIVMCVVVGLISGGRYWFPIIKIFALFTVIELLLEGVVGNNMVKYGRKVYGIYYFIFIILSISFSKIHELFPQLVAVANKFFDLISVPTLMQPSLWSGIAIAFVVALVINWITFRKLEVRFLV